METCTTEVTRFAERLLLTPVENTALGTSFVVITPFTIFFNITLIVALIKTNQLNRKSNYLIMILSISDLLIGAVCMPLTIILFINYPFKRQCNVERIEQAVKIFSWYLSLYMTLTIAIDRYVNVNPNIRNLNNPLRRLFSTSKIWILIFISLILAAVTTGVITYTLFTNHYRVALMVTMNFDLFLLLAIFILYLRFYYKIWTFTRKSEVYSKGANTNGNKGRAEYIGKLGLTVFFILIAIIITVAPYTIILTYQVVIWETTLNDAKSYVIASILLYFNSALNSVIFITRNVKLRRYVLSCFCMGQICNGESAEVTVGDSANHYEERQDTEERIHNSRM